LLKLPVVSGDRVIEFLLRLGYEIIRQKGSHVRLRKVMEIGEHNITVPIDIKRLRRDKNY